MRYATVQYHDDKYTELAVLRDRLGWTEGDGDRLNSVLAVAMLLCDRLDEALKRIAELERAGAAGARTRDNG